MKTLVGFKQPVGGDGAEVQGGLIVDAGFVKAQLEVAYPLAKLADPIYKIIDKAFDGVEGLIPGDWDKKILDPERYLAKAAILKLLTE